MRRVVNSGGQRSSYARPSRGTGRQAVRLVRPSGRPPRPTKYNALTHNRRDPIYHAIETEKIYSTLTRRYKKMLNQIEQANPGFIKKIRKIDPDVKWFSGMPDGAAGTYDSRNDLISLSQLDSAAFLRPGYFGKKMSRNARAVLIHELAHASQDRPGKKSFRYTVPNWKIEGQAENRARRIQRQAYGTPSFRTYGKFVRRYKREKGL